MSEEKRAVDETEAMLEAGKTLAAPELVEKDQQIQAMQEANDKLVMKADVLEAHGVIKTAKMYGSFSKAVLYQHMAQIKDHKTYKALGMTWAEYCKSLDMEQTTVDRNLKDLRPLMEAFAGDFQRVSGIPLKRLRKLGSQMQEGQAALEGDVLTIGTRKIALSDENFEDIEDAIDELNEKVKEERAKTRAKTELLKAAEDKLVKQENEKADRIAELESMGFASDDERELHGCVEELRHLEQRIALTTQKGLTYYEPDMDPKLLASFVGSLDQLVMVGTRFLQEVTSETGIAVANLPDFEWLPDESRDDLLNLVLVGSQPSPDDFAQYFLQQEMEHPGVDLSQRRVLWEAMMLLHQHGLGEMMGLDIQQGWTLALQQRPHRGRKQV